MPKNASSLDSILHQIARLPHKPGCYLFLGETRKVIYIGATTSLKKRVSSYFKRNIPDMKTRRLVSKVFSIDYEIHDSEESAFLRERELIRIHSPRFNMDWKDDKQYPLIRITVSSSEEKFSRLFIVRDVSNKHDYFFGRKTDVKALRSSVRFLRKIFPVANKTYCFRTKKPCLDYSISRCLAPCVGKVTLEYYQQIVEQFVLFLQGKKQDLIERLYTDMNQAADKMQFEIAARIRDRIRQIEVTIDTQKGFPLAREKDVIILLEDSDYYLLVILWFKDETIVNTESKFLGNLEALPESEIIKSFIHNYYLIGDYIPSNISISCEMSDEIDILEIWLSKRKGKSVQIVSDQSIKTHSDLKLEIHRYQLELGEKVRSKKRKKELKEKALHELQDRLGLESPINRIETFDISNIQGTDSVGSMVVFQGGFPQKSQYRRFKIKTMAPQPNDVAMLKEVISRRLTHKDQQFALSLPDLFVIDGGKPQVNAVFGVLQQLNCKIPVIGLAKKEEEIFFPHKKKPISIPQDNLALQLLQQGRDEAHRFAISYHQKRRLQRPRSQLDQIPGVGPKRRNALIHHFGDVNSISKAAVEDLCEVEGISRALAEKIFLFFVTKSPKRP